MRIRFFALSFLLPCITATSLHAQESHGRMRVALSGRGTTEVTLTLVDSAARAAARPAIIKLDYGQPSLRGRALLTDSLVPYDKAWRTGANGATTLTTDVDLMIGGSSVPRGRYIVQTIPGRNGWKLLIQKDVGQSPMEAAMTYNPQNDIARIDLKQTTGSPLETFTMWLIPAREAGNPRGLLALAWGTIRLTTDWTVR